MATILNFVAVPEEIRRKAEDFRTLKSKVFFLSYISKILHLHLVCHLTLGKIITLMLKLKSMIEFLITPQTANQRVDKYVKKLLPDAPLSFIYKLFRKKDVKVNKAPVKINYILQDKEVLTLYIDEQQYDDFRQKETLESKQFPYEIIYEDENILIVNKPAGLLVHGGNKKETLTLTNAVLAYLKSQGEYDETKGVTIAPAHRLDRNTAGLIVYGKSVRALQALTSMFEASAKISKKYLAIVSGNPLENGKIKKSLKKDHDSGMVIIKDTGDKALTTYEVLENFASSALVELNLISGRTHQLRVHLASINHPIIGDGRYGDKEVNKKAQEEFNIANQLLVAHKLIFLNPPEPLEYLKGERFIAPLPKQFEYVLNRLRKKD